MKNSNLIGLKAEDCKNIAEKLNILLFNLLPEHTWSTLEYKRRFILHTSPKIRGTLQQSYTKD